MFTERLPSLAAPSARRTLRLATHLLALGLALGRAAGVRLSRHFRLTVGRNTLLQVIRRQGFRGRHGIVALSVRRMRQAQGLAPWQRRSDEPRPVVTAGTPRPLTPRRAT